MKKAMLLLICNLILYSCTSKKDVKNSNVQVSVIVDETDQLKVLPETSALFNLYNFDFEENIAATFRIRSLTDKQLNPVREFHLPDGAETEKSNQKEDPYYREKVIQSFYTNIKHAVMQVDSDAMKDSSLQYSECFRTLAEELQRFQKDNQWKSVLVVFSDLQENSDFFTCYSKANQIQLCKKPDSIVTLFNNTGLLPKNLKGVEVFFIYKPISRQDDQRFAVMASIFKKLLVDRGCDVKIQANSDFLN